MGLLTLESCDCQVWIGYTIDFQLLSELDGIDSI